MTKREFEDLMKACRVLDISYYDARLLMVFSRQLHSISERECNGFISPQSEKWNSTRKDNICREIETMLTRYERNLYFYHQTDPRGCQIYIIDLDDPKCVETFNEWLSRDKIRSQQYYGTNLQEFFSCYYTRFGIAF